MANSTMGFTYDDAARKESLWDVIVTIDPIENYLGSTLETVNVSNIRHEWPQKSLRTNALRAGVEGGDPTYDNTNPSRDANYTHIISVGYEVSGSEESVDQAGMKSRMGRERSDAMKDYKNFLEHALVRSSLITGNNSAARQMKGLKAFASTLATSQSGVSFSETQFNDYLGLGWNSGVNLDTALVGATLKRRISGFTAGASKNVDAVDAELINRVDVYDSDFGRVKIIKHRYVTIVGTDTNNDLVAYDSSLVKHGMLRAPKTEQLAKTGDAMREMVVGEHTLQVGNEKAVLLAKAHL